MSRATRYLILCGVLVAATLAAMDVYLSYYPGQYGPVIVVALLFFLPGRVSSHFLKDLYRSRRFFDLERYDEAIERGEDFLETLRAEPWRSKLIYLTWSLYSWNVEAIARNNIGAASMMKGNADRARREFMAALARDPNYALPYANLAALEAAAGAQEESERLAALACRNGYSGRRTEKLVDRVAAAYAKLQGAPLES